jgi:hypothetical protein
MNSQYTQIPFDFYYLNIGEPNKGNKTHSESFLEVLFNDVTENSNYEVNNFYNPYQSLSSIRMKHVKF